MHRTGPGGGMSDVVCIGIVVADIIARPVDSLPERGTLGLVEEVSLRGGGCALNTGTVLARLGRDVVLAGKVGRDPFGDFLKGLAVNRGLDVRGLVRDDRWPTSATVVIVDATGERTFLHCPGANDHLRAADLDQSLLAEGRILHVAGGLLMAELDGPPMASMLERARRCGVLTSLDTAFDASARWSRLASCLPHLDVLAASVAEARAITGCHEPAAAAQWLRDAGVREVAIKLGPDGCYASGKEFAGRIDAIPIEAVDGTGAGDAFVAGLLHGKLAGWPLERAVRFANAAGALATTSTGATEGFLGQGEVDELLGITQ